MTRAAEDALIQHLLPVQAEFFSAAEPPMSFRDLQGVGGGKAEKLEPFYPCDESSAMYSQLTTMRFIR